MRRALRLAALPIVGLASPAVAFTAPAAVAQPAAESAAATAGAGFEPAELFVAANRAYEEGDPERAVRLYERLLEQGGGGGHLRYNLGNAYLRNGELGRAIASYRRARDLMPRDEDVLANLHFARRSAKDALAPPEPSAVQRTLFFWHYGLGRGETRLATVLLNLLFWSAVAARATWPRSEALRWLPAAVLGPLLAVAGSWAVRDLASRPVAVVIPQEVHATTAPAEEAVVRFDLHAGSEVRVRARQPGWVRIALPDGEQGWLRAEWVEIVD